MHSQRIGGALQRLIDVRIVKRKFSTEFPLAPGGHYKIAHPAGAFTPVEGGGNGDGPVARNPGRPERVCQLNFCKCDGLNGIIAGLRKGGSEWIKQKKYYEPFH